ncbi:Phospholipid scramblase 4 [Saguinus oedipus]|uniref:Phospholipid scramblase n=1 Tax=Saguinus oedipus TaxID=9490 RepID=A0ABQ9U084_SAGOE|nr:Phospholipid scramblase 4 [Saguinus oedipus]
MAFSAKSPLTAISPAVVSLLYAPACSYLFACPPGTAVPPHTGYPGGLPMAYYSPQQPGTFPSYQPIGGTHPVCYQPGNYPVPNQPVPLTSKKAAQKEQNTTQCITKSPKTSKLAQLYYFQSLGFANDFTNLSNNCPLTDLDNIHVLQHFEPLEMMTHFEANNRYDIKNNWDQMVYIVTEDTDDFTRNAYRTLRPFVLRVTDCMGREIMTMQRPFRCTCCCFCCPSARQEVREWKSHPVCFNPTLHSTVWSF